MGQKSGLDSYMEFECQEGGYEFGNIPERGNQRVESVLGSCEQRSHVQGQPSTWDLAMGDKWQGSQDGIWAWAVFVERKESRSRDTPTVQVTKWGDSLAVGDEKNARIVWIVISFSMWVHLFIHSANAHWAPSMGQALYLNGELKRTCSPASCG